MNYEDARDILGLPDVWDIKSLNKAFRLQARRFHPDKNKSSEANLEFDIVKRAYDYLLDHKAGSPRDNSLLDDNNYKELFDQFNNEKVAKLYSACKEVVSTAKDLLQEWKAKNKGHLFEHTIKVSLSQMLNDEMYVLKHKDETYYVPLWYPSVYFDLEDGDALSISIDVDLPDGCSIDDNNKLIIAVSPDYNKEGFDVQQFLSPRSPQYNQKFCLSMFSSGASFTLPSAGLLRVGDIYDEINIKDRQSVTFFFK